MRSKSQRESQRESQRVFVYGSLLRGLENHGVLTGARFGGCYETAPGFRMYEYSYFPAVVAMPESDESIVGEVYDVDAAGMKRLDRLEGHPSFYCRTWIDLCDGSGAWCYLLRQDQIHNCAVVNGGDWRKHHSAQSAPRSYHVQDNAQTV